MAIEHSAITDVQRHPPKGLTGAAAGTTYVADGGGADTGAWTFPEPKGAAAASIGNVYISNGAASGSWVIANPHGNCHFTNLAVPSTFSATTSYQVLSNTTISGSFTSDGSTDFTHTAGRLTYTGTLPKHIHIVSNFSLDHSSGANRDITMGVYKNGVLISHAETIQSTSSGTKVSTALHADVPCVTNDYFELACKASATATVQFYNIYFYVLGTPD